MTLLLKISAILALLSLSDATSGKRAASENSPGAGARKLRKRLSREHDIQIDLMRGPLSPDVAVAQSLRHGLARDGVLLTVHVTLDAESAGYPVTYTDQLAAYRALQGAIEHEYGCEHGLEILAPGERTTPGRPLMLQLGDPNPWEAAHRGGVIRFEVAQRTNLKQVKMWKADGESASFYVHPDLYTIAEAQRLIEQELGIVTRLQIVADISNGVPLWDRPSAHDPTTPLPDVTDGMLELSVMQGQPTQTVLKQVYETLKAQSRLPGGVITAQRFGELQARFRVLKTLEQGDEGWTEGCDTVQKAVLVEMCRATSKPAIRQILARIQEQEQRDNIAPNELPPDMATRQ